MALVAIPSDLEMSGSPERPGVGTWTSDNLLPSVFIAADSSTTSSPTAAVLSLTSCAVDAVVLGIDGSDDLLPLVFIAADSGTMASPTAAIGTWTSCTVDGVAVGFH